MDISKLVILLLFVSTPTFAAETLTAQYFEEDTGCWVYIDPTNADCQVCSRDGDVDLEYTFSIPRNKIGSEFETPYILCHACEARGWGSKMVDCPRFNLNGYDIETDSESGWGLIYNPDMILEDYGNIVSWRCYEGYNLKANYFKICLYYPLLEIEMTSSLPSEIKAGDEVIIEGLVRNIGDINAEDVTVKLEDSDFNYEPSSFSFDLTNKNEDSTSEKKIRFTMTPKTGRDKELNYELNGIRMGTVVAKFEDFKGGRRETRLDIGNVDYIMETEETTSETILTEPKDTSVPTPPSSQCLFFYIGPFLLALIVLERRH